MAMTNNLIGHELRRLDSLQGSDPAFFVLATHCWIEAYLRRRYGLESQDKNDNFFSLLTSFIEEGQDNSLPDASKALLKDILRYQTVVNKIRHGFFFLGNDEAISALHRLIGFCHAASIQAEEELKSMRSAVGKVWQARDIDQGQSNPLRQVNASLQSKALLDPDLDAQLRESRVLLAELDTLRKNLAATQKELRQASTNVAQEKLSRLAKDARLDQLRQKAADLSSTIRQQDQKIASLQKADQYRSDLIRLTAYTRSRRDFERNLSSLSPDQEAAIKAIGHDSDFLIRGSAGTGKTIVLLKAIEKLMQSNKEGLDFGEARQNPSLVLLTYSKTLVNYSRYLGTLFELDESAGMLTVDKFLGHMFKTLYPEKTIEYETSRLGLRLSAVGILSEEAQRLEIEDLMLEQMLSQDQYLAGAGLRPSGSTVPELNQRKELWQQRTVYESSMKAQARCSPAWAWQELLAAKHEDRLPEHERVDYLFVDEVQDLSPLVLAALKACTRRGLIMAGDGDQALFRRGFSFKTLGIDIVGKSKVLRTNFRNTVPIHELVERFWHLAHSGEPELSDSQTPRPSGYRFGPLPELGRYSDLDQAFALLIERLHVFIDDLGYVAENIGIIVRRRETMASLATVLDKAGIPCTTALRDDDFDFAGHSGLRLMTLHGSKGLDFPVVIFVAEGLKSDFSANEVYVALSRAMEQLLVLVPQKTKSQTLLKVLESFAACQADWGLDQS